MKRIFSWLLFLALMAGLAVPALADEPLSILPAVNGGPAGYADVPADIWYADAAQVCYETGLMTGTLNGFEPERTLTVAEVAALSARLAEALSGKAISQVPVQNWYQNYVDYLSDMIGAASGGWSEVEKVLGRPEAAVTRQEFLWLLALALSPEQDLLPAINAIQTLPDTDDATALRFYNAGVLTGTDVYGTFAPDKTLTRAEAAAMVARVVRPQLRQQFTPQPRLAAQAPAASGTTLSYEEEFLQTEALRVNGGSIPFSLFLDTLNEIVFRTDFALAANNGSRLDWDAQYQGVDDLNAYFVNQAVSQAVQEYLLAAQCKALGCSEDALPQALTPDPAAALGKVYRAKHILVDDEATAWAILTQLMTSPSLAYFDQLMAQYNTDPGMTSNPDGYLFTDGDMVTPFENAVKALKIGSCSTYPVQSDFGWHIIVRLDPTTYPDWEKSVQSLLYEHYVEDWMNSATVTPNTVELGKLDVRSWYEKYLANMGL